MKRFIIKILCFFGIPLLFIIASYIITDPFGTIKPFSLFYKMSPNREYQSFELFKHNFKKQRYNSFIFGSSRGCGLNTYQWKKYLSKSSKPFLFQAWGETLTGIYQKIAYLRNKNIRIQNAIILIDIPGSFSKKQEPTEAIGIKHYELSEKTKLYYQSNLFIAYLKPSEIYNSINAYYHKNPTVINFDTITNDWNKNNKYIKTCPKQDRTLNKDKFISVSETISSPLIDKNMKIVLDSIKKIFNENHTIYKIIVTPAYTKEKINPKDLEILQKLFDKKNVYNYSGNNEITSDKYNFMDINHFDGIVGWKIIEEVYN